MDLPAIGPGTVEGAARAGLAGVAVEAGGVMILNLAATRGGGRRGRALPLGARAG